MKLGRRLLAVASAAVLTTGLLGATTAEAAPAGLGLWTGTWASSPQAPGTGLGENWSVQGFAEQSVRQIARLSAGGPAVRVRLANTYGKAPLRVTGATVARSGEGAAVREGTVRPLTFGLARSVAIPAGGEIVSDPALLPVSPLDRLTVTLYFAAPTGPVTFHAMTNAASYRAQGDRTADTGAAAFTDISASGYLLSGIDVLGPPLVRDTVVAFGDSITEGYGSTVDENRRYPDRLAERLHGRFGVLNEGIGGNRVLNDSTCFGEKATARFERDVVERPDVRSVIVLEGINDIGSSATAIGDCFVPNPEVTAEQLIAGHRELIKKAHAKGIKAIGATLTPFVGAGYYTERGEAVRKALNEWIRTSGEYDAVADYDRALGDPANPDRLLAAYDSGDHLHPSDAGYEAMAAAVRLADL
ncbi:SGNH/GDSL hydrolase family protein [Amycolatopsis sp. CA-230715]|uniref:SGNH/GDSL hydrolase family protein n=1 Tax=Amycolatopsis sp. CA-230715 TaxID=2745196 RepID=UPI001C023153|nr:SGNH/GDSL hydrolase family protein [Amycolatopsis sp. CA-230715]